jgi:hypothetical protein
MRSQHRSCYTVTMQPRVHPKILSTCENIALAMSDGSSRDKAHANMRCEAKLPSDTSGNICSRKGIFG